MSPTERRPRTDLLDVVGEDRNLNPEEKETVVRFAKDEDRATVFTAEAGIVRRLLQHPKFIPEEYRPEGGRCVESAEEIDTTEDRVVAVEGTVPTGTLKVRASSRDSSGHASVVSNKTGGGRQ
jgi:hypothetical protein